ncbi:uncharacterized protein C8Q71DRAFT_236297 [Rhodofomes roseus]|uniref:Zn(2)-C6 fungal-type domain-containing protein n=1 Tax=Rhodofomes roseus TaxID=34475 RepID=A0ABQ8KVX6_9APHY|nr:uncharacterized protein C8Q71DRAFT_236297 [Rhodofomes roseus]KAH9843124.1 hypothetical protein C8Q71DRAFT_236297 [Rhodofomes roseus]
MHSRTSSPYDRPDTHPGARGEPDFSPPPRPGPSHSQTTLPPIRALHPGLPLPSPHPQSPTAPSGSAYGHLQSPTYPVASGSSLGARRSVDDSDPEGDVHEPPKKKRRRQALSCTECKRRKIKCDRAQPCGPCTRRGEPQKCQWHIIEPMEKYVTRTEYDELKAKVIELEALVNRLTAGSFPVPAARMAAPTAPVSSAPIQRVEPIQGTAITPYHAAPPPSMPPSLYHAMPPSRPIPARSESSSHLNRHTRQAAARSPSSSSRPSTSQGSSAHTATAASPAAEPSYYPTSPHASSSMPSTPAGSSGGVSSRRASLSVAAMTNPDPSPYHHHHHESRPSSPPKKCSAQTPPPPGQRLRRDQVHLGSAQASSSTHPHHYHHHDLLRSPTIGKQRASLIPA